MSTTRITDQLVLSLMQKYADLFVERFPFADMKVYYTGDGTPPLPPGIERKKPEKAYGTTIRVRTTERIRGVTIRVLDTQRIGIYEPLPLPWRLSTFFHEYGHATYNVESNEDENEGPGLIRSETNAMLSSLRLPDNEGLPEIAIISATVISAVAKDKDEYRGAFENISNNPLWLKYAPLAANASLPLPR